MKHHEDLPEGLEKFAVISDGWIELIKFPYNPKNTYPIEGKRLNNAPKVLGWLLHLGGKGWFKKEHAEVLILYSTHCGARVNRHA